MKEYYLAIYSSVTLANRVKHHMKSIGDYVNIIHAPKILTNGGCSYALRFKSNNVDKVKKVSEELGIKVRGFYKECNENNNKIYLPI